MGKSTILTVLTGTTSEVAAYEFTTLTCIPGIIHYNEAKIQLLDLPGIIEGAAEGKGEPLWASDWTHNMPKTSTRARIEDKANKEHSWIYLGAAYGLQSALQEGQAEGFKLACSRACSSPCMPTGLTGSHWAKALAQMPMPTLACSCVQSLLARAGRGRQVIAVCKSADLLLMVLDASKPHAHRKILTAELEAVGIRLNR